MNIFPIGYFLSVIFSFFLQILKLWGVTMKWLLILHMCGHSVFQS